MNKIRKICFTDIDGILLDFNSYVKVHLAKAYGIEVPENYVPENWSMTDLAPKGTEVVSWEKAVPDDWVLQLKPFANTKRFLNKMRKKGYYVVMVTRIGQSRQIHRLKNLIGHGLPFSEIYFTSHGMNKAEIIDTVLKRHKPNKWIFVDDKASTCKQVLDLKRHNSKVYTLDLPFNKETKKENPKGLIWLKTETELYERILGDA